MPAHRLRMILDAGDVPTVVIPPHGMAIRYGEGETPFGICRVAATDLGICHASFTDIPQQPPPFEEILRDWPEATITIDHDHARRHISGMFDSADRPPLLVTGTPFQIAIWRLLLEIPAGTTVSYGGLAAKSGNPMAARAVGGAVGANAIAWWIPCHRVLPAGGKTGGYRWGSPRKASMLAWESRPASPAAQ